MKTARPAFYQRRTAAALDLGRVQRHVIAKDRGHVLCYHPPGFGRAVYVSCRCFDRFGPTEPHFTTARQEPAAGATISTRLVGDVPGKKSGGSYATQNVWDREECRIGYYAWVIAARLRLRCLYQLSAR